MLIKYDIALFPLSFLGGLQEQQHASPKPDVSVLFFSFSVFLFMLSWGQKTLRSFVHRKQCKISHGNERSAHWLGGWESGRKFVSFTHAAVVVGSCCYGLSARGGTHAETKGGLLFQRPFILLTGGG